jgi:hypothetical protein
MYSSADKLGRRFLMRNLLLLLSYVAGVAFLSGLALGQDFAPAAFGVMNAANPAGATMVAAARTPDLAAPVPLPRMAPELALQAYQGRSVIQNQQLSSYSATTVVRAELPDTAQQGEFELQRHFEAPRTLQFTALHYSGDGFVKSNIIIRLLQSEVDHVKQDDGSLTAINEHNYKFSYKGTAEVNGRLVHTFQVKPRKKRAGLFKGRIYIDAYHGSLVRAEGGVVKSPSFFIKKIEFVQDYANFGNFTFPVHIHSDARARVIGRAVVDIYHRDYQPVTASVEGARQTLSLSPPPSE